MGLDPKIRCTLGRKRLYEPRDSYRQSLMHRPQYANRHLPLHANRRPRDKEGVRGRGGRGAIYVEKRMGVGVWLEREHASSVARRVTGSHCYELHN